MVHKLKRSMKNIYAKASIKSSYLAHFLNMFKFEKICSCLETLKGGNKSDSANSLVGAGGARDM